MTSIGKYQNRMAVHRPTHGPIGDQDWPNQDRLVEIKRVRPMTQKSSVRCGKSAREWFTGPSSEAKFMLDPVAKAQPDVLKQQAV